jgi:hypothetical protein
MAQYRKKPVVIEATQWFAHGDHPAVMPMYTVNENGTTYQAFIQTIEGKMIVTPGDWIITGVKGEHYPCKHEIFLMTYEAA